jgi:hypothetical protein
MFEKLKVGYANMKLKQESAQVLRERTDPDIHNQARIGILYDATGKEDFEVVKEFFRDLKVNHKAPVSLGYIDYLEPTFHPLARPEFDYFFKNQVNWYKKPTGPIVENFIDEPFDILINLSLLDFYPLDYITAVSKAGLKIGRANSAISFCYDMSFFLDEKATLKSFAYLIIHYLSNINHDRPTQSARNRSSHYYSV